MDLGIAGRSALICASSRGLGRACAEALAAEGVNITLVARGAEALEATAADMRSRYGVQITAVAADIATAEGRQAVLAACPSPDILVNNAGGPPVGDWRKFDEEQWRSAVDGNMIAAIMLIREVVDGMAERGFGRIINITSALVKMPHELLGLSVAARLGLTGFTKAIAQPYARSNVTVNNMLPEQFETDRLRSNLEKVAAANGRSFDEERAESIASSPAERMGRVEEFGAICAFYCSVHAGYVSGQNLMIDGARYPGVF